MMFITSDSIILEKTNKATGKENGKTLNSFISRLLLSAGREHADRSVFQKRAAHTKCDSKGLGIRGMQAPGRK